MGKGEKGNLLSPDARVIFVKSVTTSNFCRITANIYLNTTEVDKGITTIRTGLK